MWRRSWLGSGGWGSRFSAFSGSSTSKPFWVSGVTTMKMMSSTNRTSMRGVTLMSELGPPLFPVDIAISMCSFEIRSSSAPGFFLGDEADLVRPGVTTEVHDAKNVAVLQSLVSLEEEDLLSFAFELLGQLGGKLRLWYRSHVEEDGIVLTDGDGDGVFVVRMVRRKLGLGELDVDTFLQQKGDHHEDDEHHQHDVRERSHVDVGVDFLLN